MKFSYQDEEGKAESYTSELFQDIPTTVGCLWKKIAAVL